MGKEKPKIRWQTYVVAACWAAFLIAMAWVVPAFREMFDEMRDLSTGASLPLPFSTRAVVGIPAAVWILLGLLVPAVLVWKSKLVSQRTADVIDQVAVVAWFLAGMGVGSALFLPLTRIHVVY